MGINELISLIGNVGFPVAISSYLLIQLKKQMCNLPSSINKLNTIISAKLGIVIDTSDNDNTAWEIDIKYGYVHGEDKFFYTLNVIDVFYRSIIDYHMGLHCEGKDAAALIRRCLIKRNLFAENCSKPVIRSDNGPQFISHIFEDTCSGLHIEHERIPVKTPNKNAHIESFHRILEYECFKINEFQTYAEAYKIVNKFMIFYNERRLHSSLNYMPPKEFYTLYLGEHLDKICIKI